MSRKGRSLAAMFGFLALVVAASACGTASSAKFPEGSIHMTVGSDSPALVKRFFPGYSGRFYAVPGKAESPVLGVIWNPKKPSDCFFAGASSKGSWSVAMTLEAAGRRVTGVGIAEVTAADIRKDGTNDVFIVLEIRSKAEQGEGDQVRTVLYVFELDVKPALIWYQTLALEGDVKVGCRQADKSYAAGVDYVLDEFGRVDAVTITSDLAGTECSGGDGCKEEKECVRTRDEAITTLTWDAELRRYADKEAEESVLKIPDVSL